MKKHNTSIRLFNNPILERLTHVHPVSPILIFSSLVFYFSYAAIIHTSFMTYLLGFSIGMFLWTLLEYTIHRFIYHFEAVNEKGKSFIFLMHGIHHKTPKDITRLVSPPIVSVAASSVILILYRLFFGSYYESIFVGTMTGYLIYDLIHFSLHYFNSKNRLFRFLKEYHFSHHYFDGTKAFGVSTPLWDFIFKTMPDKLGNKSRF